MMLTTGRSGEQTSPVTAKYPRPGEQVRLASDAAWVPAPGLRRWGTSILPLTHTVSREHSLTRGSAGAWTPAPCQTVLLIAALCSKLLTPQPAPELKFHRWGDACEEDIQPRLEAEHGSDNP